MSENPETTTCPHCKEEVKWEAFVCKFCHRSLMHQAASKFNKAYNSEAATPPLSEWNSRTYTVLAAAIAAGIILGFILKRV